MNSLLNRPKSAVKLIYTIDRKNERILLKKDNEQINNKQNLHNIQFKNENLFQIFEKQREKVSRIELLNKKEGSINIIQRKSQLEFNFDI